MPYFVHSVESDKKEFDRIQLVQCDKILESHHSQKEFTDEKSDGLPP